MSAEHRSKLPPSASLYKNGCRCDGCREAMAAWMRDYTHRTGRNRPLAEVVAERRADAEDKPHGTESRYSYGCRCAECRAAVSKARRERRHANRVPCSHGCGTLVDLNPTKPPECHPCATRRIHAERRDA